MKNMQGFTLVEMMVTVAISAIIAYSIFMVMRSGESQIQASQVKMQIQDSAREGLYRMAQEIRLSAPDRVTILNNGTVDTSGNVIEFDVPDPAGPVNPDFSINWAGAHSIRYCLTGEGAGNCSTNAVCQQNNQICRVDETTGGMSVLANDVEEILFEGNGAEPSLVTITLGVQREMVDGRLVPEEPLVMAARAEVRNL